MIEVGSDCSGVGAFQQALSMAGIAYKRQFSCDFDYHARVSYCANYGTKEDLKLALSKEHKYHADRVRKLALGLVVSNREEEDFKQANEFAKKFSFYFPFNMYQREIPNDPLDIYVGTFPCQSFSIAGKRKGEDDKRGILFYNGLEIIKKNKPRYFILENVKGLLSHDPIPGSKYGRTFTKWLQLLGGKSVNGDMIMFPHEDAAPYHIYYRVLNATDFNVPQNRERIFIVGIRDDEDNDFRWPYPIPLQKRLIDVLEDEVDEKYFLSEKMVNRIMGWKSHENPLNTVYGKDTPVIGCLTASGQADLHAGLKLVKHAELLHGSTDGRTIRATGHGTPTPKHNFDVVKVGYINQDTQASQVYDSEGDTPSLCAGTHGYAQGYIQVKSANKDGYEVAKEGDAINLSFPESDTRRGRVGKEVAQALDTGCKQGVMVAHVSRTDEGKRLRKESMSKGKDHTPFQAKKVEFKESDVMNTITCATQKDNLILDKPQREEYTKGNSQGRRVYKTVGVSPTVLTEGDKSGFVEHGFNIRRLTPRECYRLMGFPDSFKIVVSDTQAYKQAGNSIVVHKLAGIIKNLKL